METKNQISVRPYFKI